MLSNHRLSLVALVALTLAGHLAAAPAEFIGTVVAAEGGFVLQYTMAGEALEAELSFSDDAVAAAVEGLVGEAAILFGTMRVGYVETMPPTWERTLHVIEARPLVTPIENAGSLTLDEADDIFRRTVRNGGDESDMMALTVLERSGLLKRALAEVLSAARR